MSRSKNASRNVNIAPLTKDFGEKRSIESSERKQITANVNHLLIEKKKKIIRFAKN